MHTVGIIGGLGPESTVDYYRSILARYRARNPEGGYPHILINSLDVDKGIAFLDAGRPDELAGYLQGAAESLARAGADFGCIAANTPHLVFDELERRSPIPLISIVRATVDHATTLGWKKLGLFGTGFTMRASNFIHRIYMGELLKNQFLPQTRSVIATIAHRMKAEDEIEALILAGTELPLLLRDAPVEGLPFLDATNIHVEAIVDRLLS
jgi:aspartate racemase